jgi:hemoglobin/transferrin/lactoferrin receptor protein
MNTRTGLVLAGAVAAIGTGVTAADVSVAPTNNPATTEVVITATRIATPVNELPFAATVLDATKAATEAIPRTLPEMLADEPGVMVQKTGSAQGSPYIRGFTGFRNLMMIDGIRLNNSVFREGANQYWGTVDSSSLGQVELVRGAGSVLYGSDAVGGVLNARTRGREDYPSGNHADGRLYSRYAAAEDALTARAEFSGNSSDDAGILAGYTRKWFGDMRGGRDVGLQPKTGYDEDDWDLRIDTFPGHDTRLTLLHQAVRQDDAWRTHSTIYGTVWSGTTVGTDIARILDQDRYLTAILFETRKPCPGINEARATVSHHRQIETQFRIPSNNKPDDQGFTVDTYGASIQFDSPSLGGNLTYGADTTRDCVDSYRTKFNADGSIASREIQGPVADDATYDLAGAFIQQHNRLGQRADLFLGGRVEYVGVDADRVLDPVTRTATSLRDNWSTAVGQGRVQYALERERRWHAYAGVAQSFRAPNLSDLTRLDTARSNEMETPSPDLDPERYLSYEAGVRGDIGWFSTSLSAYYTGIHGMIVRTPTGVTTPDGKIEVTKRNSGDGYATGAEACARVRFAARWSVFADAAWMDGEVETYPTSDPVLVKEPLDRLMPLTGHVGVRWEKRGKCWIESVVTLTDKADKLSTSDRRDTERIPPGGTPGYTVCDLRGGWHVSDNTTLSLAVENVTDEDYRIHGSGVNEPGRNLVLAADMRF